MRSFNENESPENILPERRAQAEIEVKRAEFLRDITRVLGSDTTELMELMAKYKKLTGEELLTANGERFLELVEKLRRIGPWALNIYCCYFLDLGQNGTETAKRYNATPQLVDYYIGRVNDIFANK